MKKLLLILLLVNALRNNAQTYVLIPDPNFVTYLQGLIPTAMSGNSLNIASALVTTSTHTINVSALQISNLTGIQYFSSLTTLNCSYNNLTSLPTLPNSITTLFCNGFSGLANLTSLPTLPNSLTYLECSSNSSLTSLPVLPNTLTYLNCSQNSNLTNLSTLPNSLQILYCNQNNNLTSLPPLAATSLQTLVCNLSNALTSLPTLPNTLQYLDCNNQHLTTLPALPTSLQYLQCGANLLTNLPPLVATSLQTIECWMNSLTGLPTLPNTLQYLACNQNSLTSLPSLPNSLQNLACYDNFINCFPSFPNSITAINLVNNPFNCLPNYVLPAMDAYTTTPLCASGNSNGCPVANGIKENSFEKTSISIYPNPSTKNFTIDFNYPVNLNEVVIQINDVYGLKINTYRISNNSNEIIIDSSVMPSGTYLLSISFNNSVVTKKFVKI